MKFEWNTDTEINHKKKKLTYLNLKDQYSVDQQLRQEIVRNKSLGA